MSLVTTMQAYDRLIAHFLIQTYNFIH